MVPGPCALAIDGITYLATVSGDGTARIWNPADGCTIRTLTGHGDWVQATCTLTVNGTTHLATAGKDRTVRVWDPEQDASVLVIPTRTTPCQSATPTGSSSRARRPGCWQYA